MPKGALTSLIPVEIVTGFLGSGKTTLVRHILDGARPARRIAVIVNDLAELNIDGEVIRGVHVDRMVRTTGGCICCSGIYQLGLALREIVESSDPTLILIETSGAASPGPVAEELLNLGYRTASIIAVIDALQFRHIAARERIVSRQIEDSDFVVVNKVDLVDERTVRSIRKTVERLNPRSHVVESVFCRIPTGIVLSPGVHGTDRQPVPFSSDSSLIDSFSYTSAEDFDPSALDDFLKRIPPSIYRIKGILRFHGNPEPHLLNFTCGRYQFQPFPELKNVPSGSPGLSRLVFIGRDAGEHANSVRRSLDGCRMNRARTAEFPRA